MPKIKLLYESKKPFRIKTHSFYNATAFTTNKSYWFSNLDEKYKSFQECIIDENGFGTHSRESIRSIKAFVRWIRKHYDEFPIGTKIILVNNYVGYNVEYIKN